MAPKMIVMDNPLSAMDIARELAPPDIDMIIARADSPEFRAALPEAEYLVGLGEVKMDDAFYKSAPKLKLIQLLSAGYDRVEHRGGAARRRAGQQQRRRQRHRGRRARHHADAGGVPAAGLAALDDRVRALARQRCRQCAAV
jgi:phosphoglycerate dehydrogenase-like enzyme